MQTPPPAAEADAAWATRPLPGAVRTTADLVHEALRADLLGRRWAPGSPLPEVALARALGVSRTPVREALRRLEAGGLVSSPRGRGLVVADLGEEDLVLLGEGRALLEAFAARTAAARRRGAEWRPLSDRLVALEQALALRGSAPLGVVDAHRAFHLLVYELAFATPVARALCHVAAAALDAYSPAVARSADTTSVVRDHRSLLAEMTAGDPDRAARAAAEHARGERPAAG